MPWAGHGWGPSETIGTFARDTWLPYTTFSKNAIRRSHMAVNISYESDDPGVEPAGSGNRHPFARMIITQNPDDPPVNWPGDANSGDDQFVEPIVWGTAMYTPGNIAFGRPERVSYRGSLSPGLAMSHGQRLFDAGFIPLIHWYVGPLDTEAAGPASDFWAVSVVLRVFYETNL